MEFLINFWNNQPTKVVGIGADFWDSLFDIAEIY